MPSNEDGTSHHVSAHQIRWASGWQLKYSTKKAAWIGRTLSAFLLLGRELDQEIDTRRFSWSSWRHEIVFRLTWPSSRVDSDERSRDTPGSFLPICNTIVACVSIVQPLSSGSPRHNLIIAFGQIRFDHIYSCGVIKFLVMTQGVCIQGFFCILFTYCFHAFLWWNFKCTLVIDTRRHEIRGLSLERRLWK